jgi:hypothetical protein
MCVCDYEIGTSISSKNITFNLVFTIYDLPRGKANWGRLGEGEKRLSQLQSLNISILDYINS